MCVREKERAYIRKNYKELFPFLLSSPLKIETTANLFIYLFIYFAEFVLSIRGKKKTTTKKGL